MMDFPRGEPIERCLYWACTEPYLKGSFVCNAQRASKSADRLRGTSPHALRRDGADSRILQQTRSQAAIAASPAPKPAIPRLPSYRDARGVALCDHRGDGESQRNADPAIQWGLPEDCGTQPLSRSDSDPKVSQKADSQANPTDRTSPRLVAPAAFRQTQPTKQPDLRFGFHRAGGIRTVGGGSARRLQPQETRTAFLPSSFGFRVPVPGILAWVSASWRCWGFYRSSPFHQGLPGQGAQTHPQVAHPLPVGFRVLWEARGRIPRRRELWICDRRQKAESAIPSLSRPKAAGSPGSKMAGRSVSSGTDLTGGKGDIAMWWCAGPSQRTRQRPSN